MNEQFPSGRAYATRMRRGVCLATLVLRVSHDAWPGQDAAAAAAAADAAQSRASSFFCDTPGYVSVYILPSSVFKVDCNG